MKKSPIVLILAAGLVCYALWISMASPISQALLMQSPLLGVWAGADVAYLARYDPKDRSLDLLSIPTESWDQKIPNQKKGEDMVHRVKWLLFENPKGLHHAKIGQAPEISYYIQMNGLEIAPLAAEPGLLFKTGKSTSDIFKSFETNLNWLERILIFWEFKELSKEKIYTVQLPGQTVKGVWISEPKDLFLTTHLFLTRARFENFKDQIKPVLPPGAFKTTVEVWNASQSKSIALEMVRKLRKAGFDVVQWGNYPSKKERTLVYDRKGKYNQMRDILSLLPPTAELQTRIDHQALVDIEIVLGSDYRKEN